MLQQLSTLPETSGASIHPDDGRGGCSGPDSDGPKDHHHGLAGEEADRNSTANRWPREETMALLKIRSEMDVAFRDTTPKAPLWQQISRRLGELGYHRSAKKCKEKFENIYKYHRRTKDGRYGKPNSKTYRFFEQLEALQTPHPPHEQEQPTTLVQHAVPCSIRFPTSADYSDSTTSSNTKDSAEAATTTPKSDKRRLTQFFERLMKEVVEKQESLHRKFMEVLEKCEQDRIARDEAWKMQELARINRERELLAHERSVAAAKDAALLAILKKLTEQSSSVTVEVNDILSDQNMINNIPEDKDKEKENSGVMEKLQEGRNRSDVGNFIQMSSSRWPKEEVEALIRLRTNMDLEYDGNGPKGPLWEEMSSAMKKLGYNRSAKRCKEKWENINKYFKRMREKNKRRPEDSKTCPYFHQLDALYSSKKRNGNSNNNSNDQLKAEELLMHIMSGQEDPQSSSQDAATDKEKMNQNEGDNKDDGDHMVANSTSIEIMG
ncbi:Trihelix transcription factor GT-2 [Senna tora]|uniref:Trihelix transcription factor GT-2 n=1 Tax=Senna tora TaxID=362788 RepID=A0A834WXG9_9FABA|nr:Trihelix transcription factor GT-2 [Senna tora]